MQFRGTSRIGHPSPVEDGVWISDGIMGFEIPESMYRDGRYNPPLESLPWGPQSHRPVDVAKTPKAIGRSGAI
jgi:hypothetical protein